MAASAAQAAEQVALNAHITLRELKGMIDTVVEKKLPTFKTLMEMNPVAVARTSVNGAKLTAYENGYAVYEVDSAHTVMAVERCGDYRYDFTDKFDILSFHSTLLKDFARNHDAKAL